MPPAVAVNVTCVFCGKLAVQVVGQLIPAGLLVIVPVPVAGAVTVKSGLKAAVILTLPFTVRLQVPVPEQLPPHPPKV